MKSYIEINDADYKFILAKGGRIERILLTFSKDDIADVVFKPIMNDLKQAKGVLINFIIPNEHLNIGDLEKFILKINEIQKFMQHYFLIIRVDFLLIISVISP